MNWGWVSFFGLSAVIGWSGAVIAQAPVASPPRSAAATRQIPQRTFANPAEAAHALASAMRTDDSSQIEAVLGPGSDKLIRSGDPVEDTTGRARFLSAYETAVRIENVGDANATILIGPEDFPFPYPLVRTAKRWRFDAKSGAEEILNRRIGRNERAAIQVCLAYVDAQREYALKDRDSNGVLEYAQKFISTPGRHDGLYWVTAEGESPSPLGPLSTRARDQGYEHLGAAPYYGYFYRILTAQGKDNPGGAYDYVVRGKMIGGFALVAYPARWGISGVMTFICNHRGIVHEKNLGPRTATIAETMSRYDPGPGWKAAGPQRSDSVAPDR